MAEEDIIRAKKDRLNWFKEKGIEPYPAKSPKGEDISKIIEKFQKQGEFETSVTGRIVALRRMGKASFGVVFSNFKKIQFYIKRDDSPENYDIFKHLDIGDFVFIKGKVFRTKTGEITIHTYKLKLLAKSIRVLPEKWHGLRDEETILRKRYLDILTNENSRKTFILRSKMIAEIRKFLNERGFFEVETPILQNIPGGAEAEPFVTHHNALDMDLYLRIAPELYLKRLIVGGFEKVYEIGKNFRNEGISTKHNPEFTMLELYMAWADFEDVMDLCEELIKSVAEKLNVSTIDVKKPFKRVSILQTLKEKTGFDFSDGVDLEKLKQTAELLGVQLDDEKTPSKIFENVYEQSILSKIDEPVFLVDFPEEFSPLAKTYPNKKVAQRFELYIKKMEIANAYSELNDPEKQSAHFQTQVRKNPQKKVDKDFIEALEYGMPPTGGLGIGLDRLLMVLLDLDSIKDVIIFPHLKPR